MRTSGAKLLMIALSAMPLLQGCVTSGRSLAITPSPAPGSQQVAASSPNLLATLEGGLVSRMDGLKLARTDGLSALESEYRALEYTPPGEAVIWTGRGAGGSVTPSQPYRVGSQDCRQFTHSVQATGRTFSANGTACRNEDGSWSILPA